MFRPLVINDQKILLTLCTKFEMLVAPSELFSKLLKFCMMYFITKINKMGDEEVKNLKFDFSWITLINSIYGPVVGEGIHNPPEPEADLLRTSTTSADTAQSTAVFTEHQSGNKCTLMYSFLCFLSSDVFLNKMKRNEIYNDSTTWLLNQNTIYYTNHCMVMHEWT